MSVDAERREQVDRLLREGLDHKLQRSSTHEAVARLEAAHREATRAPELAEPWPSLTAYRLAHGLLRVARSAEELERVRELFVRADSPGHLGPLPRVYRLAVLHRLRSLSPEAISEGTIDSAFRRATEGLVERKHHRPLLGRRRGEQERRLPGSSEGPIQDGALNLLELAAYFLGAQYEPLSGCGPFDDLQLGSPGWVLVGPDPRTGAIRYPEPLARAELEACGAADPQAVLFELPGSDPGQWRVGAGLWKQPRHGKSIELLCGLLVRFPAVDALRRAVGGSDPDSFRQHKRRLKDDLSELTGRPRETLLEDDAAGRVPRIAPGLDVYGVVKAAHPVLRGTRR